MRNKLILFGVFVFVAVVVGYSVWVYTNHLGYLSKTMHETIRWAVIRDSKEDIIAVETTNHDVWNTLVSLHHNHTEMWIGGVVEEYENKWEFRFKPDTIVIAQITIEGAQSNIQGISRELDYWMNVWAKEAYVLAKVAEIHE
jgi:hypothetical protein